MSAILDSGVILESCEFRLQIVWAFQNGVVCQNRSRKAEDIEKNVKIHKCIHKRHLLCLRHFELILDAFLQKVGTKYDLKFHERRLLLIIICCRIHTN
jgi:hypothetical protein